MLNLYKNAVVILL